MGSQGPHLEATIGVHPSIRTWTDAAGLVLLLLLVAVVIAASRGDRSDLLTVLMACATALAVGRVVGAADRVLVPGAVVAVAGVVVVAGLATSSWAAGGAFGYEGSAGAFFAQASIAGLMVAVATQRRPWTVLGGVAAVVFALLAGSVSAAALVSLGTALVALPAIVWPRWARPAVIVSVLLLAAVLTTTMALGATYREGDEVGGILWELRSAFTERKVALWHATFEILSEEPAGVGPGRFDDVPPRFLPGPNVRWAENGFLQQGAELGWAGLILTVLLFLWGFARLLVHPAPDAFVALGAAALACLGIHASVSHILHSPAVLLVASALVGAAQASPSRLAALGTVRARMGLGPPGA